ncbi:hypothetical protein B4963_0017 [Pectobacterium phage phiA41]|uniref:Tail spike TSP1/Gp66 N-terminal domain-containing protein n=1 Tax=Pectobacterium phage phiA41 TaxID=1965354 RepID=A0A678P168_9CAUD|nr:virion structural protein [Pectobacterium phage phiA41]ARB11047.1 hypothetical protein B4963_0017 [Pectobacterium phage phiA41]
MCNCEPWNCVEQAVNDVWSTKRGQITGLVDRAETAADNSEISAKASADSAVEAREFRDEAELAATTAVAAQTVVVGVATSLQNTADSLEQSAEELSNAIAGITVVTWYYTAVSENQTVIPVPDDKNQIAIQAIYSEGARKEPGPSRDFTYDPVTKQITLVEGIPLGQEIAIILGVYPENSDDITHILASSAGAGLIGTTNGNTVQDELNNNLLNDREQWRRSLAEAGLTLVDGSFEEGATVASATDAIWHAAGGQCYTWGGAFPKTVDPASTPASSGGVSGTAWVSVTDLTLRSALAGAGGAAMLGAVSGKNVQEEIDDLHAKDELLTGEVSMHSASLDDLAYSAISSISEKISEIKVKDTERLYDAFGNTVYYKGRNLFSFRRAKLHFGDTTHISSLCIGEIYEDGSYAIIWQKDYPITIDAKDPFLSIDNVSGGLIVSYQLMNVAENTYRNAVIGVVDLSSSGSFITNSTITTTSDYFLWGNVLRTPAGKYITTRYAIDHQSVDIITSSDANLNAGTTWSVARTFLLSEFAGKTAINETCLGYYKGMLVAVTRTGSSTSSMSTMHISRTNDLTGASGWINFGTNAGYAGPHIPAYTDEEDPLIIVGSVYRDGVRSDVSMAYTFDLASLSTPVTIAKMPRFNAYASAKKVSSGIWSMVFYTEYDENPDATHIYHKYFYFESFLRPDNQTNRGSNWDYSFNSGHSAIGNLGVVNSITSSHEIYFSMQRSMDNIKGVQFVVGPMAASKTITPVLYRLDGSLFASCASVTIPASPENQIVTALFNAGNVTLNAFSRMRLNLLSSSDTLPIGSRSLPSGHQPGIPLNIPFNLFNSGGLASAPYFLLSLVTL